MSKTFNGSYSSGITLTNASYNPVTVTGTINAATGIALYATAGIAWSITNQGTIETKDSTASGVRLASGGSIDNASSAALIENLSGIAIYAAATATGVSVVNAGSILGNPTTGIGVELLGGGNVSNASGGTITAGNFGVALSGGVVTNQGVITSSSKTVPAVLLNTSAATVSNQSGGTISGEGGGIYGTGVADTVVNAGRVQASSANGIALVTGGTITNQSGGTITGSTGGIYVRDGAGLLINSGLVTTTGTASSAVDFALGGTITNKGTGDISAATGIVITGSAGTVVNSATIIGTGGGGVELAGGRVTNTSGGTVSGANYGVRILSSSASVVNHGRISGGGTGIYGTTGTVVNSAIVQGTTADGIELTIGGTVTNQSGGTISGSINSIYMRGAAGLVINDDLVSVGGSNRSAIDLADGGAVTNAATATISGSATGIVISGGVGTVLNAGTVIGSSDTGVLLELGGHVTDTSSGTITGANYGVRIQGAPGTVITGGMIVATNAGHRAVWLSPGYSDLLMVDPSAAFTGLVDGGNAIGAVPVSTLELASGANMGSLTGLGTEFIDFARISVASAASWTIASTVLTGQAVTNSGTLAGVVVLAGGASLTNTSSGTISGTAGAIYVPTTPSAVSITNAGTITVTGTSGTALNLDAPASVSNTGVIGGANVGVDIQGVATVVNQGSIGASASGGSGVNLRGGGLLSNTSTGMITGPGFGAYLGVAGTVVNNGSVDGAGNSGVAFNAGGTVTNGKGATISGHYSAIGINGGFGSVTNDGAILALTGTGLAANQGANVTNQPDGTISALDYAIEAETVSSTVSNLGSINGTDNDGVGLFAGGMVSNASTGTITGYSGVAISGGAGTVTNAGRIGGTGNFALRLAAGYVNLLTVDPGATFGSRVDGGNTIGATQTSTLELAPGATAGTLSGLGTQFVNFGSIAFDTGADWFVSGNTSGLAGTIGGFTVGDTIELTGITATGSSYSDGVLTIEEASGSATLAITGSFATGDFLVTNVADGTDISVLCFCSNTLILTPSGQRPVQELAIGDPVVTLSGATRRIVWIGCGKVLATRGQRSAATPVIVRKGALGDSVPNCDLHLTKGHALYLEDALIPVEFLVNNRTIEWDDRAQEVELYHIELGTHDVLIANGAPAESYRDDGNRWLFRNANSGWQLPAREPCAPVLTGGATVDTIWQRLLQRAGPRRGVPLTDDPDLHLLVDGKRIDAIDRRDAVYAFRLAARPRSVRICSRSASPLELGLARDPRVLGVAIRRIVLGQARRQRAIEADAASLMEGYHAFEAENEIRWTDGDAAVPAELFAGMSGSGMLILELGGATRYFDDGAVDRVA